MISSEKYPRNVLLEHCAYKKLKINNKLFDGWGRHLLKHKASIQDRTPLHLTSRKAWKGHLKSRFRLCVSPVNLRWECSGVITWKFHRLWIICELNPVCLLKIRNWGVYWAARCYTVVSRWRDRKLFEKPVGSYKFHLQSIWKVYSLTIIKMLLLGFNVKDITNNHVSSYI